MYLMGADIGYQLAGMKMDLGMTIGMLIIPPGCALAGWGLLPRRGDHHLDHTIEVTPPEDAPLSLAHWWLMLVLVIALVIDIMKPASLGFVVPGMIKEYGVGKATVAWLPFAALTGTVAGSIVWGFPGRHLRAPGLDPAVVGDVRRHLDLRRHARFLVERRHVLPDGRRRRGLLPVVYALLAETMPSKHRGWALVLIGGLGAVGGYLGLVRLLGLAAAAIRLADHVVPQPADRPDPGRPVRRGSPSPPSS